MALRAAESFMELTNRDFRILETIELGMRNHEYVPIDLICDLSGFGISLVERLLKGLHRRKLIVKRLDEYVLLKSGYDTLALRALVKQDILDAIGDPIGIGKESDVYEGIALGNRRVAIKFHRLGRPSFQQTRRLRGYAGDRRHLSDLYEARLAAERENEAIMVLFKEKIRVPEPIGYNRHVVCMEFLEGDLLQRIRELPAPAEIFEEVMEDYIRSVVDCGIIHGDFSEYNIMIREDFTPYIIDWPQNVHSSHPNAEMLILRDIEQIRVFFSKLIGRLFGTNSPAATKITRIAEECRHTLLTNI